MVNKVATNTVTVNSSVEVSLLTFNGGVPLSLEVRVCQVVVSGEASSDVNYEDKDFLFRHSTSLRNGRDRLITVDKGSGATTDQGTERHELVIHVMMGVVALEEGLTHKREVVRVGHDEHDAGLTITKHVPDVVLWLNADPHVVEHQSKRFKLRDGGTLNKDDTLLNGVLRATSLINHFEDHRFEKCWRHKHVR